MKNSTTQVVIKLMLVLKMVLLASNSIAETSRAGADISASVTDNKENIHAVMSEFSVHLLDLETFTLSRDKFNDPKNSPLITEHLKKMIELSKKVSHTDKVQNNMGLKFSRDLLEQHLTETERVFRLGNREYAHWMINTTVNICLSCHTQMPGIERHFDTLGAKEKKISPFEQAELFFTFRSFDKAIEIYDDLIKGYPKNGIKIDKLETAIRRKLSYYVRVKQSPEDAINSLKKNILNKNLPLVVRKTLNNWSVDLKSWNKIPTPNIKSATEDEIRIFVKKLIGNEMDSKLTFNNEKMTGFLRVSGFLYQYLSENTKNNFTGEILYWLALSDRRLSNDLFYSLADIYLKECIRDYSKLPIAKKCFDEYKDGILFSYTGSSGTNIPADVQAELKGLEDLITPTKGTNATESK